MEGQSTVIGLRVLRQCRVQPRQQKALGDFVEELTHSRLPPWRPVRERIISEAEKAGYGHEGAGKAAAPATFLTTAVK
ncbi:hypothetical protein HEK131_27800 [Streptomyces seoulensis]|nr:hypothetical protein HEK131_27800 [Streptomyces seoulensis]